MAIDVLSQEGFGDFLGKNIGTGLASGLNQLANLKMNEYAQNLERQRYASGLSPLLGQETANFLSNLNPEERKYALQNLGSLSQLTSQPGIGQAGTGILGQLTPEKAQAIGKVFTSPAEQRAIQELELRKQEVEENRKLRAQQFKEKQEAAISKTKEAERYKRQQAINKKNQSIIDPINKYRDANEKADELLSSMEKDLASGNVASGWSGTLQRQFPALQNETTARYAANATELPSLLNQLPGVTSDYKRKLDQASKAFINQPLATQQSLLEQARNYINKRKLKAQALDNVLEKYGENQPPNIENEIKKEMHRLSKKNKKVEEFQPGDDFNQEDYDHPEKLPDGFAVEWDGIPQQIQNGQWVPLEGA